MEFFEYPKRIDDEKVVNSKEEEIEYLKSKGVVIDDKKDETGVQGSIPQGEESRGIENDGRMSKEIKGRGDVQTHEQEQESPSGVLKRKPGRPKLKPWDERGFKPK